MRKTFALAAAIVAASALTASAQVPEQKQSGSPTQAQFKMQIVEPKDGATIQGSDFNVVLALPNPKTEGTSVPPAERRSALTPIYQVWLDGKDLGNIPATRNVMNVHADREGAHKIIVVAKNAAGQVIGRQEMSVTTVGVSSEAASSSAASAPPSSAPAPASSAAVESRPASSAPSYASSQSAATAPAMSSDAPAPAPRAPRRKLPKTSTAYPAAAVAGALLAGAGILLRRRV